MLLLRRALRCVPRNTHRGWFIYAKRMFEVHARRSVKYRSRFHV
jgi:hypothetical protein